MKSIQLIAIILLMQFCVSNASAQETLTATSPQQVTNTQDTIKKPGVVNYIGDPRIHDLLETQKKINKRKDGISGFRVQLYSGDRKTANEIKAQFINDNEVLNAYIVYEQPYFKTRVGDFRTRIEAEKALLEIGKKYLGSFVLTDFIVPTMPQKE